MSYKARCLQTTAHYLNWAKAEMSKRESPWPKHGLVEYVAWLREYKKQIEAWQ